VLIEGAPGLRAAAEPAVAPPACSNHHPLHCWAQAVCWGRCLRAPARQTSKNVSQPVGGLLLLLAARTFLMEGKFTGLGTASLDPVTVPGARVRCAWTGCCQPTGCKAVGGPPNHTPQAASLAWQRPCSGPHGPMARLLRPCRAYLWQKQHAETAICWPRRASPSSRRTFRKDSIEIAVCVLCLTTASVGRHAWHT
jgi:hypothetical protein